MRGGETRHLERGEAEIMMRHWAMSPPGTSVMHTGMISPTHQSHISQRGAGSHLVRQSLENVFFVFKTLFSLEVLMGDKARIKTTYVHTSVFTLYS